MRTLIFSIIAMLLLTWTSGRAHAYTMTIDIREDRIDITRPTEIHSSNFAQEDMEILIRTQGLNDAPWRLQILAIEDMLGPESIPIGAFSWQAFNPPFIDGHLVKGVPQILAQGTGDIETVGRVRFKFRLANYEAGDYFSRLRFILNSP